jgi:hypothetical protein
MRYATLSLLPLLASASPVQVGTIHNEVAPLLSTTNAEEVPNSYMIVFKKHVKDSDAKDHHEWVQSIHTQSESDRMELRKRSQFPLADEVFEGLKHTYTDVLKGYSGHFDDETIEQIRRHPHVSSTHLSLDAELQTPSLELPRPLFELRELLAAVGAAACLSPQAAASNAIARDGCTPSRYRAIHPEPRLTMHAVIGRLHREGLGRPHHGRQRRA